MTNVSVDDSVVLQVLWEMYQKLLRDIIDVRAELVSVKAILDKIDPESLTMTESHGHTGDA